MSLWQRLFGKHEAGDHNEEGEEFDRWDAPILEDLRAAIVRLLPAQWDSAAFVLEVTERGLGAGLSHSAITRTEGEDFALREDQSVAPDAAVLDAARQLEQGWIERGDTFQKAIITIWRHHDESEWGIRSVYEG